MGALPAGWRVIIISIVTYAPDLALLATVLDHLGRALRHASRLELPTEARLILVDNGPGTTWRQPLQQMLDAAALPARVDLLSGCLLYTSRCV